MTDRIDVDFSLAIHNRTGKYFIGRDLLDTPGLTVGEVYYWRLRGDAPPKGLVGKVAGRLQHWQIVAQTMGGSFGWFPRRRPRRPLLHLDPFTVPTTHLRAWDAVLCHDIGPVTHPALFDADVGRIYAHIYKTCERVGSHMIFVSEATRQAYLAHYPATNAERTRVIYPATRAAISTAAPVAVPGIDGPFLLTVGSIGDRKNQARCIEAFVASGLAACGVRYVICGGREPGHERVEAAASSAPGVIRLPYVSDGQLSWLYGQAQGFVLVSLLEGFGMPVAEAIARDLVPLVSRDSVLHEVAGDGALLADSGDTASITAGMIALAGLTDNQRAERLVQLRHSIERFDLETIRNDWHRAFADIIAEAKR